MCPYQVTSLWLSGTPLPSCDPAVPSSSGGMSGHEGGWLYLWVCLFPSAPGACLLCGLGQGQLRAPLLPPVPGHLLGPSGQQLLRGEMRGSGGSVGWSPAPDVTGSQVFFQ